jgi:2-polyprenyl-3-methyl-5-hydroxy-6-metoxy-1,4-benzoquinol methylase
MPSIKDDKGYNQGFKPCKSLEIRTERRVDYMISNMDLSGKARILEIGCGTGELSYMLARKNGSEVLGTDICRQFIDEARNNHKLNNLHYEVIDFNRPDELKRYGSFDYVIGNGIIHHLFYSIDQSLANIRSLLKNNGKIIFLEPNLLNPYCFLIFSFGFFRKLANLEPGEMAFTKRFIANKLAENGFSNIKVEYKDFLLPITPAWLIKPVIAIGSVLERTPILNKTSQSIYISAVKA